MLLDDGNLELRVLGVSGERVECEVVGGGPLRSNKGMNLPGVALSTPALTDKDRRDLAFGIQHMVDFVALSFVRQAQDVLQAKELVASLGARTPVIAKIEKPQALDNLEAILAVADASWSRAATWAWSSAPRTCRSRRSASSPPPMRPVAW